MSATLTALRPAPASAGPTRTATPGAMPPLPVLRAERRSQHRIPRAPWWQVALVALPLLGLLTWWTADDGGYDPMSWYPGALGLCALAVLAWMGLGASRRPLAPAARLALAAFTAYVAWSYLSILWAGSPGVALEGANRALLYLLAFALCARLDWTRRRLRWGLSVYLATAGAVALAILVELALAPKPDLLIGGQLGAPLGYHNATAALGTIVALGAIAIGCRRELPVWLRAALAGAAVAGLELCLLAQSRGWLYTLPVIVALMLVACPSRTRTVLWALVPVGASLATLPWISHTYSVSARIAGLAGEHATARADMSAARAGLVAVVVAVLLAALVARIDGRFRLVEPVRVWLRRALAALALAIVLVGCAGAALFAASGAAGDSWRQFSQDQPLSTGTSRYLQLGSGRYDFWRVAVDRFAEQPLLGIGQDNFAEQYIAARHTGEEPSWVHSIELRLLLHTGIIGALLFALFLGGALWALVAAARAAGQRTRALLATALVPLLVWLIYGSVDWFWEIPALSVPALAALGAATALAPRRPHAAARDARGGLLGRVAGGTRRRSGRTHGRPPAWSALLVLGGATAAVLALLPATLGEHALQRGRSLTAEHPAAALRQLARASSLQPFSSAPGILAGAIELQRERPDAAARQLARARQRDPGNWLIWLETGLAEGMRGRLAAERQALRQAATLDPREPVIRIAQRRAGTNRPLTISEAANIFRERVTKRLGR